MSTAATFNPTAAASFMQKHSFSMRPAKWGLAGFRMCVLGVPLRGSA
jgi:hypothetical protein